MKQKIFQALKNKYSHLGLGDDVLSLQAATLEGMGFVTDDNLETVISAQQAFLEGLQKQTDKRVTESIKKTTDELGKKHEEELKAKEAEARAKAKEEAEKEAKAKAEAAAKAKKEEEERKAAEEAERKRREEAEKHVPDAVKKLLDEMRNELTQSKTGYEEQIKQLIESHKSESDKLQADIKALTESSKQMSEGYAALKKEREEALAKEAKAARAKMILDKALSLGIPQSRIDEGFVIADDADENKIDAYLSIVAKNSKASTLPGNRFLSPATGDEPSKDEVDNIASSLVGLT